MKIEKEKLFFEQEEKSRRLEDVMDLLKTETDEEKIKELTKEAYPLIKIRFLESGGVFHDDIEELYHGLRGNFIVRMDSPERVVSSIGTHEDLRILPKKDHPNAVEWRSEYGSIGLQDAFSEGTGMLGGLITVIGFKKGRDIKVGDVGEEEKDMFGRERGLVRVAKGRVHPKDVQFVILRLPTDCFPEEEITPQEKMDIQKRNRHFIFRGFAFNESAKPAREERIAA
ncbi:MAG: hypothetical protein V2A55_01035 [Candidatus Jorgensenbacteria bacterium]